MTHFTCVCGGNRIASRLSSFAPLFRELRTTSSADRLPGDHLEIREGVVYINGQKLDEPYAPLHPTPWIITGR